MSKPFLNWAGKAERLSFDVPTLPLFIHERLSTEATLETLKGHKRHKQTDMFSLFGNPHHSFTDQVMRAYEWPDNWVNRMILGDSLVVMNSLLRYENLGRQVQMIYMDPPYGVKFGSNFQPFVRKRDVTHNDDKEKDVSIIHDMSNLPDTEQVQFFHKEFMPLAAEEQTRSSSFAQCPLAVMSPGCLPNVKFPVPIRI
ncbi:MAG TPA: hypothetical protein VK525_22620 [Candidatus Saccharimonadales bacterium]|nr:hypothetical protein [Candidatus Saccharimonadales bacterium]